MIDRMIELLEEANYKVKRNGFQFNALVMAEHLLANGVIVFPVKVGTTVYIIEPLWYDIWCNDKCQCFKCKDLYEGGMGDTSCCSLKNDCCYHIVEEEADVRNLANWMLPNTFTGEIAWGKTVFLTREEAEKALAERKNG